MSHVSDHYRSNETDPMSWPLPSNEIDPMLWPLPSNENGTCETMKEA